MMQKNERGFSLLEVMLAVVIFGFILMMVAQIMNGEIRMLNAANRQNEIEQKTRTAMVHILDEIKLNRFTSYREEAQGVGIYVQEPDESEECLIYIPENDVSTDNLPDGTTIYYQPSEWKLWYRNGNSKHLIADNISSIQISQEIEQQLLKIRIQASNGSAEYELLTWTRMY